MQPQHYVYLGSRALRGFLQTVLTARYRKPVLVDERYLQKHVWTPNQRGNGDVSYFVQLPDRSFTRSTRSCHQSMESLQEATCWASRRVSRCCSEPSEYANLPIGCPSVATSEIQLATSVDPSICYFMTTCNVQFYGIQEYATIRVRRKHFRRLPHHSNTGRIGGTNPLYCSNCTLQLLTELKFGRMRFQVTRNEPLIAIPISHATISKPALATSVRTPVTASATIRSIDTLRGDCSEPRASASGRASDDLQIRSQSPG